MFEHNYIYGECEFCGAIDSNYMTVGLVYTLINDGTEYSINGYKGSETDVIIPAIYKGKPVTSIGYQAFEDCDSLTSVVIGDSVTSIGNMAFYDCDSLTSIEIPNSLTSIGYGAFVFCDNLQYHIEDGLKYLGNESNKYVYLKGANSTDITSVVINSNCKLIGNMAFYDCDSLTSIVIPDSVTSICDWAFAYCDSLTSIVIPNSVTSIGIGAFAACNSLTSITVDKNNPNYIDIYGNLYSKDGKTLMQYAVGKTATEFTISNNVTSIGDYAFSGCDSLTSIEIPNSLTSIGDWAFSYCDSLTSIVIPDSVTSIGYYAFENCDSLTIYCQAESKPSGWASNWKYSNIPVVWGYEG